MEHFLFGFMWHFHILSWRAFYKSYTVKGFCPIIVTVSQSLVKLANKHFSQNFLHYMTYLCLYDSLMLNTVERYHKTYHMYLGILGITVNFPVNAPPPCFSWHCTTLGHLFTFLPITQIFILKKHPWLADLAAPIGSQEVVSVLGPNRCSQVR